MQVFAWINIYPETRSELILGQKYRQVTCKTVVIKNATDNNL